jgi:Uma2 family endonuclease
MAVKLTPRRLTVDEYDRMGEVGILTEDERTELIDGEIVCMSPIGGPHVEAVMKLNHLLVNAAGAEWRVSVQNPISLPPHAEPQPDFSLVRARRYGRSLPRAEDVLLVIEVSDSSLAYDREIKLPLYAAAGIVEAWIIDINSGAIVRYRQPERGRYTMTETAGPGMLIESMVRSGLTLAVDDTLDLAN